MTYRLRCVDALLSEWSASLLFVWCAPRLEDSYSIGSSESKIVWKELFVALAVRNQLLPFECQIVFDPFKFKASSFFSCHFNRTWTGIEGIDAKRDTSVSALLSVTNFHLPLFSGSVKQQHSSEEPKDIKSFKPVFQDRQREKERENSVCSLEYWMKNLRIQVFLQTFPWVCFIHVCFFSIT